MPSAREVKLGKRGQMVLPKPIRDALGLKEGDRLLALLGEGEVLLVTPQRYAALTRGLLRGTWGRTRQGIDAYLQGERTLWESETANGLPQGSKDKRADRDRDGDGNGDNQSEAASP